jgi:hypothetical protein
MHIVTFLMPKTEENMAIPDLTKEQRLLSLALIGSMDPDGDDITKRFNKVIETVPMPVRCDDGTHVVAKTVVLYADNTDLTTVIDCPLHVVLQLDDLPVIESIDTVLELTEKYDPVADCLFADLHTKPDGGLHVRGTNVLRMSVQGTPQNILSAFRVYPLIRTRIDNYKDGARPEDIVKEFGHLMAEWWWFNQNTAAAIMFKTVEQRQAARRARLDTTVSEEAPSGEIRQAVFDEVFPSNGDKKKITIH